MAAKSQSDPEADGPLLANQTAYDFGPASCRSHPQLNTATVGNTPLLSSPWNASFWRERSAPLPERLTLGWSIKGKTV